MDAVLSPEIALKAAAVAGPAREHIRVITKQLGINRLQLAQMLGVNRSQICRWESGQQEPNTFNAVRLYEEAQRLRGQSR